MCSLHYSITPVLRMRKFSIERTKSILILTYLFKVNCESFLKGKRSHNYPYMLNAEQEASSTIFNVFGMTRSGIEPTTSRLRGESSNHWATAAVNNNEWHLPWAYAHSCYCWAGSKQFHILCLGVGSQSKYLCCVIYFAAHSPFYWILMCRNIWQNINLLFSYNYAV